MCGGGGGSCANNKQTDLGYATVSAWDDPDFSRSNHMDPVAGSGPNSITIIVMLSPAQDLVVLLTRQVSSLFIKPSAELNKAARPFSPLVELVKNASCFLQEILKSVMEGVGFFPSLNFS